MEEGGGGGQWILLQWKWKCGRNVSCGCLVPMHILWLPYMYIVYARSNSRPKVSVPTMLALCSWCSCDRSTLFARLGTLLLWLYLLHSMHCSILMQYIASRWNSAWNEALRNDVWGTQLIQFLFGALWRSILGEITSLYCKESIQADTFSRYLQQIPPQYLPSQLS